MLEGEDHGRQRLDVYPFYDPATIDIVRAVSGDLTCVRVAFCVAVVTQRFLRMFAIGPGMPSSRHLCIGPLWPRMPRCFCCSIK